MIKKVKDWLDIKNQKITIESICAILDDMILKAIKGHTSFNPDEFIFAMSIEDNHLLARAMNPYGVKQIHYKGIDIITPKGAHRMRPGSICLTEKKNIFYK